MSTPSTSATGVLNTRSGLVPGAVAASSPYESPDDGPCPQACTVEVTPAAAGARAAGVPPPAPVFVRAVSLRRQFALIGWLVRSTAGNDGSLSMTAVSRRSSRSSAASRDALSGCSSSLCFTGVSAISAAATR